MGLAFSFSGASFEGWLSQPKLWLEEGVKDFAEAAGKKGSEFMLWGRAASARVGIDLTVWGLG